MTPEIVDKTNTGAQTSQSRQQVLDDGTDNEEPFTSTNRFISPFSPMLVHRAYGFCRQKVLRMGQRRWLSAQATLVLRVDLVVPCLNLLGPHCLDP